MNAYQCISFHYFITISNDEITPDYVCKKCLLQQNTNDKVMLFWKKKRHMIVRKTVNGMNKKCRSKYLINCGQCGDKCFKIDRVDNCYLCKLYYSLHKNQQFQRKLLFNI